MVCRVGLLWLPRTPPLWQRGFFWVNCLVLRRLLASVRSGAVNTFRYVRPTVNSDFDPSQTADAYRAILQLGLEYLQRAALPELHPYLRIEIDHLHNIPKYISDASLVGHGYYYCNERPFYLESVADTPIIDVDFMLSRYQPHWDALRDALAPYAGAINSLNWNTKL